MYKKEKDAQQLIYADLLASVEKEKSPEQIESLLKILDKIPIFQEIEVDERRLVAEQMQPKCYSVSEVVIREGDVGDMFYVVCSGEVAVYVQNNFIRTIPPDGSFGDIALMFDLPRTATCVAKVPSIMWTIDRDSYRSILMKPTSKRRQTLQKFLKGVPCLARLPPAAAHHTLIDQLYEVRFQQDTKVTQVGDKSEYIYFIVDGEASTLDENEQQVTLMSGDHFGGVALLRKLPQLETVTVQTEVLVCVRLHCSNIELIEPCHNDILESNV